MKSKYTPLVKLKKKALDRAERELIEANALLKNASAKKGEAYTLLATLSLPLSGSLSELGQAQMLIHAQHDEIERCKQELALAEYQQHTAQEHFKASMIEFEKFKYLESQEEQAYIAKTKKEEAKMLDEIGTITYKREPL